MSPITDRLREWYEPTAPGDPCREAADLIQLLEDRVDTLGMALAVERDRPGREDNNQ